MSHQEFIDSTAAYALGALDGGERSTFEAHMRGCVVCQREVDALRETAALLAYAAPDAPSADGAALRERIVGAARQVRPIAAAATVRRDTRKRAPAQSAAWLAAAACFVIAVLTGLAYREERSTSAQLKAALASSQADLAARDSIVAAFLGPEVHVVSLSAAERKPSMRVYWNHTRNIFIVTAFNVPAAPNGRTYQLWAIQKGKAPVSMGTFDVDPGGRATKIIPVAPTIVDAGFIDDCALTLEPAGGSPQPTEAPRLIGSWRHVD